MSNPNGVVLSGIGAYSKVQSLELRAFTMQNPVVEQEVISPHPTVDDIKRSTPNPKTDSFSVSTLQIPESIEELIAENANDDDDGNSSDPSE